jgi:hypothetical protein
LKIIFLHGEIFEFPLFSICLKILLNVNGNALFLFFGGQLVPTRYRGFFFCQVVALAIIHKRSEPNVARV